jgi:hypothetical protein
MATGVTISSLPAEVLAKVFEQMIGISSATVAPYMSVCRRWKVRDAALFEVVLVD